MPRTSRARRALEDFLAQNRQPPALEGFLAQDRQIPPLGSLLATPTLNYPLTLGAQSMPLTEGSTMDSTPLNPQSGALQSLLSPQDPPRMIGANGANLSDMRENGAPSGQMPEREEGSLGSQMVATQAPRGLEIGPRGVESSQVQAPRGQDGGSRMPSGETNEARRGPLHGSRGLPIPNVPIPAINKSREEIVDLDTQSLTEFNFLNQTIQLPTRVTVVDFDTLSGWTDEEWTTYIEEKCESFRGEIMQTCYEHFVRAYQTLKDRYAQGFRAMNQDLCQKKRRCIFGAQ